MLRRDVRIPQPKHHTVRSADLCSEGWRPPCRPEFLNLETRVVFTTTGGAIEEVSVQEAWTRLEGDPHSVLIDVRTQAEWAFVGLPDLSSLGKQPVRIEWSSFPDNRVFQDFAERLSKALDGAGMQKDTELLFICRSGGRSMMAAQAMAAVGYTRCRNVMHRFEGNLDPTRHRGTVDGWKANRLPWSQG
jgi:rhodanese-related sulfurtransferase